MKTIKLILPVLAVVLAIGGAFATNASKSGFVLDTPNRYQATTTPGDCRECTPNEDYEEEYTCSTEQSPEPCTCDNASKNAVVNINNACVQLFKHEITE